MVNIGGTICQCYLTLLKHADLIDSGRYQTFEPAKIQLKFSEKQNTPNCQFDSATFKHLLKEFVIKNYNPKYFFGNDDDEHSYFQLNFNFIVLTNQGNQLESLYYSAIVGLYKL